MSSIDEVRDRTDIVALISDYVPLKKAGRNYKGLCLFHGEKTPSFVVYPDEGRWHCFGACSTGGDAFEFVMKAENLDFKGALELLARRAGVVLTPASPREQERRDQRDRLRDALRAAQELYHGTLAMDAGGAARAYLAERGFTPAVAEEFQLGWAPDAWTNLADALHRRGFSDAELIAAGLARVRDSGGVYDAFRARLMIPIHDAKGRPAGFGARTLDPDGTPKYINSPQSDLFDKGKMLYALDRAAGPIRDAGIAVVVEGYTDTIRAHAAGFRNVVASLGTALTEHHLSTLKRYAGRVVLALDADAAGQQAMVRGLEVAQEGAGEMVPIPTAQGWIRFEHRVEVDLRVATLPPGQDPDDVIRADPEDWARRIDGARPVIAFLFDALTVGLDLDRPTDKTEAVRRLTPVLASIPDPISQSAWIAEFADKVRLDPRTLSERIVRRPAGRGEARRQGARPAQRATAPSAGRQATDELGPPVDREARPRPGADRRIILLLLGHLLAMPRRLNELDDALGALGQPSLSQGDLNGAVEQDLLVALRNAQRGAAPPDTPPEHRLDALPPAHEQVAANALERVAGEPALDDLRLTRHLRDAVLRLREKQRRTEMQRLRFMIAEAEEDEKDRYAAQVRRLATELDALHHLISPIAQSRGGKVDQAVVRRREI